MKRNWWVKWLVLLFIPVVLYRGYDLLSWKERRAIRHLCSTLATGQALDLELFKNQKLTPLVLNFRDPNRLRETVASLKDYKKNYYVFPPAEFETLFFLAEGFNRESLHLDVKDGIISKVRCQTNLGFFER